MRNLVIGEILLLIQQIDIDYDFERPFEQWSNRELLEFYGELRIELETEEYDE